MRSVLADITNTQTPLRNKGTKRLAPSPLLSFNSAALKVEQNLQKRRFVRAENVHGYYKSDENGLLNDLWALARKGCSEAELLASHYSQLYDTLQFGDLEREFGA